MSGSGKNIYILNRYAVNELGSTKLSTSQRISMTEDQYLAIQGFIQVMCKGLREDNSHGTVIEIQNLNSPGEIFTWQSVKD